MRKEIMMIMCLVGLMLISGNVFANPPGSGEPGSGTGNEDVYIYGTVMDGQGQPVALASIHIECGNNGNKRQADLGTNQDGEYGIFMQCPPGHSVTVTAYKAELGTATNTGGIVVGAPIHVADLTYNKYANVNVAIPEFPVALLPAMITVFGVGLVRKRF